MKIALSVGHGTGASGRYDPGAVAKEGKKEFHEFKLAKEIAKYCFEKLKNYNCTVALINNEGDMYLNDRINLINKKGFDFAVEFHLNAGGGHGVECYYAFQSAEEKRIAQAITKSVSKAMKLTDRGARIRTYNDNGKEKDYFGFVRRVNTKSLLLENAFIDTKSDRDKLITEEGQRKQGEAIAKAIADYYKLSRLPEIHAEIHEEKPSTKASKPVNKPLVKKNDKVKLTGTKYATGQSIPQWVKNSIHTVKANPEKTKSGRYRILLKEINSYVWADEVAIIKEKLGEGDRVTIKSGAIYGGCGSSRGLKIPAEQLAPKEHTIEKIQNNYGVEEALLKGINSWVAISYLRKVD